MLSKFTPKIESKVWSPDLEAEVLKKWEQEQLYTFDPHSTKPVFSIDTPPPYVNTPIHIGQAYTYTWMDAIARYKRLTGFNVLFPIGMDRNGLPIEIQTEKEYKINIFNTSREEFIEKARTLLDKFGTESLTTLKLLGHSYNNWEKKYELGGRYDTDDPEYRRLTQETFILLYKKGLIYERERTSNYCYSCHTVLSDAEVEYIEEKTNLYYITFKTEDEEQIVVATTRPELLPACKLIIFNPEDERYKPYDGKVAITPIFHQKVKIVKHPAAKQDFGSGLVMICSYGDYTDLRILRELNIDPTFIIDREGKLNEKVAQFAGFTIQEGRKQIVQELEKMNLLVKVETILQRRPVCWRSKTPIEFIPLKEIYLKQVDFKDELLALADQSKFFAPDSKQLLLNWINSINVDWVISRRRYYGTEIPLWYCTECNEPILPPPGKYYRPWKENPPVKECPKCGNREFRGEERIFDTWFDSSNSELYILGYLWNKQFFSRNFPCDLRPQGKEIVRSWLYFTMLKSYLLFNRSPFKNILINHHITDEKGEKMSKSLGNIIDPQTIIKKYGAETFRIWAFFEGNILTGDVKYSDQRTQTSKRFLTKLWNLGRLISSFPLQDQVLTTFSENWILGELTRVTNAVSEAMTSYDLNKAALHLRRFIWDIFADHYVELVKPRAYKTANVTDEEQKAAWYGLHTTFKTSLILLSPFAPFITDYLWRAIYSNQSVHLQEFPRINYDIMPDKMTATLIEFNSRVWNIKKAKGVSLKDPIAIEIPQELVGFTKDLRLMHNIG